MSLNEFSQRGEVQLHVRNLPENYTEETIKAVFKNYGPILGAIFGRDPNFVYVSYTNYEDARKALVNLNNKSPWYLKIEIVGEKGGFEASDTPYTSTDSVLRPTSTLDTQQKRSFIYYQNSNYEFFNDGESQATKDLWTLNDAFMNQNYSEYIPQVDSRRSAGIYLPNENGTNYKEDTIHCNNNCKICLKPTMNICKQCDEVFYCSRECQRKDWPEHKKVCEPLPPLLNIQQNKSPKSTISYHDHMPQRQVDSKSSFRNEMDKLETKHQYNAPRNIANIPPMAQKVHIHSNAAFNEGDTISIKGINRNSDGLLNVHARNLELPKEPNKYSEEFKSCSGGSNSSTLGRKFNEMNISRNLDDRVISDRDQNSQIINIAECAAVGTSGLLIVHHKTDILPNSQNVFAVTMIIGREINNFESLLHSLSECETMKKSPEFRPVPGDFVLANENTGEWFRGFVTKSDPQLNVLLLEEMRFINPVTTQPMPESFKKIPAFGVLCRFLKNNLKASEKDSEKCFVVKSVTENLVKVEIFKDKKQQHYICDAEILKIKDIKMLVNNALKNDTAEYKIESGEKVVLTHIESPRSIYISSKEPVKDKIKSDLQEEIQVFAKSPSCEGLGLGEYPSRGDMVLAQFLDGKYYRGIVVSPISRNNVRIQYIDYGNEQDTNLKQIYKIPEHFQKIKPQTLRVSMHKVQGDVFTDSALEYLAPKIDDNTILQCTYRNDPFKDGVELIAANNESVNQQVAIRMLQ